MEEESGLVGKMKETPTHITTPNQTHDHSSMDDSVDDGWYGIRGWDKG